MTGFNARYDDCTRLLGFRMSVTFRAYLSNASSDRREDFLAFAEKLADEDRSNLIGKLLDFCAPTGSASTAISSDRLLVAVRWNNPESTGEAFFTHGRVTGPKIGARVWSASGAPPEPLSDWLKPEHEVFVEQTPSFVALAGLVATSGAITVERSSSLSSLEAEVAYLRGLLAEQSDEIRRLRAKDRATYIRAGQPDLSLDAEIRGPDQRLTDLTRLPDWCAERSTHIAVLPRAMAGAKKSNYQDPGLIFDALELLAGPYRALRCGDTSRDEFDELLARYGLHLSGSTAPSVAGEQGDAYFVQWGRGRRFLDQHLTKGGGRDERYCFRLYFFWDADSSRAVVGSMPAHLNNSLT